MNRLGKQDTNRTCLKASEKVRLIVLQRMDFIRFYHLRSYDRINAPLSRSILHLPLTKCR